LSFFFVEPASAGRYGLSADVWEIWLLLH